MGEVCSSLTCKEKGLNHTFWTKSVRENDEGSASVRCLNPTTLDAICVLTRTVTNQIKESVATGKIVQR